MKNNTKKEQEPQSPFFHNTESLALSLQIRNGSDFLVYVKQSGSLEDYGINEGDCLIIYLTNKNDENQITLWKHKDEGYMVGFAYENFGDISINYACGIERHKKTHMTLVGVVVGVIRCFDAQQSNLSKTKNGGEITAGCAECKKEITGTTNFIKSEGWELKHDKQICLNCDLFGGGEK